MSIKQVVSVIIPVYNAADSISKTIEACLNQDYPKEKLEIIVIDDGSTDKTKEIVQRFPVKYISQEKGGPAKARNTGWKTAGGEILCFIDADCMPEKEWVAKLIKNYTSDKVAAVGGSYEIVNKQSLLAGCIHQEIIYRHFKMTRRVRALGSYNLSVRKRVLEEIGGFNEEYRMASGEDNSLSYKILKKGYTLIFDKDTKVSHYHPDKLLRYLKSQFWHGFWRVKLYIEHPDMVRGDDYSNIWDYAQPWISLGILFLLPFIFNPLVRTAIFFLLFLEIILQLPVSLSIAKNTKQTRYLILIFITFLRGFARGLGMFIGMIRFFSIKFS